MSEIVDLSLSLEDGIRTYPLGRHPGFESAVVARIPEHGREIRRFTMGSHTATHIDAMRHFIPDGATIEQIPLKTLIGPALLIHLGELAPGTVIDEPGYVDYDPFSGSTTASRPAEPTRTAPPPPPPGVWKRRPSRSRLSG